MTARVLRIAEGLSLPVEAVTQTIAILAKRRAGKSYTSRRFAEQLVKAGQQIVIVDPKGDWWGIRSAADGKSPGLPIVILGGERGDIPLEVGGGEIVAKLVAEERVSVLIDLSLFRKHEIATFMTAFLEGLYRLKSREAFRTPVMLFLDEADAIAPQKPQENETRMLGAMEDIVRRGGQRGLGCIMITQRTAVLNKNVLTQAEMIVALRTIAPQDLKAMDAWIEVHGEREQREVLMSSLPALPIGDAWFWSPGWPTAQGVFERVHVLPIETFDSFATPKPGERRIEPKNLADVDLGSLTKQMAATIEKAKENDPKVLKAEIARLKKEVATKAKSNGHSTTKEKLVVDTAAIDRAVKTALQQERKRWQPSMIRLERELTGAYRASVKLSESLQSALAPLSDAVHSEPDYATHSVASVAARPSAVERSTERVAKTGGETARRATPEPRQSTSDLTGLHKRIVDSLAELEAIGIANPTREQLAFYLGTSANGGYMRNVLGQLQTSGRIQYPENGRVALTDMGRAGAEAVEPPDTLDEFHRRVRRHLSGLHERIFDVLVSWHPDSNTRETLALAVGTTAEGGYFRNVIGQLSTAGLLTYPGPGLVRASDTLFPEDLA